MKYTLSLLLILSHFIFLPSIVFAANTWNTSFSRSKKTLEQTIYKTQNERITLYCEASFDANKNIELPIGFTTQKHVARAKRLEWEHVVPAENFGRTFIEWREGDPRCITKKHKLYKGRRCAEKTNKEYQYMQADMYNIYPAIGAVNAARSNYNFLPMSHAKSSFGVCNMKIANRKADPPLSARGKIARTYLYMENAYPRYNMSSGQRKLMNAWNTMYPVTQDECVRTKRIEGMQGNENLVIKTQCIEAGLW